MTPFQSGKVLLGLRIFNALLAIGVILLGVKLSTTCFSKRPRIPDFPIKKVERASLHELNLNELRACWEVQFGLKPPMKASGEPNPEQKKPLNPSHIPFKLIACSLHSDPEKSYAFVLDEQKNEQILVRIGENIGQTQYRVVKITENRVELESKDSTVTLEKPQPWLCLVKSSQDQQGSKSQIAKTKESASIVEQSQRITVVNASSFTKYGLKNHDQIIAIGDERVCNLKELKDMANASKEPQARLTILRQGRLIFLDVSSDFFSCLHYPKENVK